MYPPNAMPIRYIRILGAGRVAASVTGPSTRTWPADGTGMTIVAAWRDQTEQAANCRVGGATMSKGVRDHEGVVPSFRRPIELSPQGSWRVSWHCPRDLLGCCR